MEAPFSSGMYSIIMKTQANAEMAIPTRQETKIGLRRRTRE